MNKKIRDIGTGASVVGVTIMASSNIIPGISGCTGACGACGLTCLAPIVGISSILLIAITRKKLKLKKNKKLISLKNYRFLQSIDK